MGIGIPAPTQSVNENHGKSSAALSQENTTKTAKGRKVGIIADDGVNGEDIMAIKTALKKAGVQAELYRNLRVYFPLFFYHFIFSNSCHISS
ncbi:hypothetical protein [Nostoc sp. C052]|uniref:hypothetical protein n=1 Tax=Nostoc sp. C052 TaxID=2576902 RepID=UPI0015C3658C|nr:hypothetical protein [Nostoc sp. C052]